MFRQGLLLLFLFLFSIPAIGQIEKEQEKALELSGKNLTYFWSGRACPPFINTEEKYGFKIKCAGCIVRGKIKRNNRKVIKEINMVYGENWFEENKQHFYQNKK